MKDDSSSIPAALPEALPKLWGFAWRLTRDTREAEDLVQRTCVRALEKQQQFQKDTSVLSWLFAITHSIWKNELRSRQSAPASPNEQIKADALQDNSQASAEDKILLEQVYRRIEALPDDHRTVMLLVAIEGFSYKEAAKILDLPVGTVMSRLARARRKVSESSNSHQHLGNAHGI